MWRFLSILFLLFGVLTQFLLFSTTYNDWRLAGELGVGEKVLAYHGEATVTNTEKKVGSEAVYNLEVKDLHNFLVGDLGVVVHNGCSFADLLAFFKNVIKLKGSNIPKRINLHLRYLFMMQKIDLQLR